MAVFYAFGAIISLMRDIQVVTIQHGSVDYLAEVDLRFKVLRQPLGLVFTPEQLAAEVDDIHIVANVDATIVGTLVLTPLDTATVQMRQVAIDPRYQGQGIGSQLVAYSEKVASEKVYSEMVLHAREGAVAFYLKLGYSLRGEPFEEVTIPHREMVKSLIRP